MWLLTFLEFQGTLHALCLFFCGKGGPRIKNGTFKTVNAERKLLGQPRVPATKQILRRKGLPRVLGTNKACPDKKRAASRARYKAYPDKKRAARRAKYRLNPEKEKVAARTQYVKTAAAKMKWYRKYRAKHRGRICASRRSRCALAEPRPIVKELYVKEIQCRLVANLGARVALLEACRRECSKPLA